MEIWVLVRKVRGDKSVAQFAEEIGVSRMTVYNWENGAVSPSPEHMARMGIEGIYRRKKTA